MIISHDNKHWVPCLCIWRATSAINKKFEISENNIFCIDIEEVSLQWAGIRGFENRHHQAVQFEVIKMSHTFAPILKPPNSGLKN